MIGEEEASGQGAKKRVSQTDKGRRGRAPREGGGEDIGSEGEDGEDGKDARSRRCGVEADTMMDGCADGVMILSRHLSDAGGREGDKGSMHARESVCLLAGGGDWGQGVG